MIVSFFAVNFMWYIRALFTLLIVGLFDGHISSVAAMILILLLGFLSICSIKDKAKKINGGKVLGIVFSIYVISALIASQSFVNGQYFYVSDSVKYIENYGKINTWDWSDPLMSLVQTYFFLDDSNGLFNVSFTLWSYIANHYFDGTTPFYLTLFLTLFGLLTSLEIYKLFTSYFEPYKAAKYTCVFVLLSLFHIYSVLIIRDIVIAYFYMLGLRKVIGPSRISDILILLFVMVVTVGVRLYTGLFFGAFIMFWLYKLLLEKRYKKYRVLLLPIIVVGIVYVGIVFASSILIERTAGQVEHYDDIYSEESGISARLRSLPIGISQLVILFFSQLPLDNFHRLSISHSFSNYYISFLAIIYYIFGFVIFYGLMYYCIVKGFYKKMGFNEKGILIIMLIFIALNLSTHIDVRRSMEAIPFIYLMYMLVPETYDKSKWRKVNKNLITAGVIIMFSYSMISKIL